MTCDCMTEPDPLGGPDKVLTHSGTCPQHPDSTASTVEPVGLWWLDCGADSGVWPCEVLRPSMWGHWVVKPTHPSAPDFGEEIHVPQNRIYDSNFNRPTRRDA